MRIAILGNSGSGKSMLARWIADYTHAPLLDLDTVFWEPGKVAVARSPEAARRDVHAFCATSADWIIEGCYAALIGEALRYAALLILLNPGEAHIKGRILDIWVPSCSEANRFGRKNITVSVLGR